MKIGLLQSVTGRVANLMSNHMQLKFNTVRIFVTDLKKSVHFYRKCLGFKLVFINERSGWAEFELLSGFKLSIEVLHKTNSEFEQLVGRFSGISFTVDNVFKAQNNLQRNDVVFTDEPEIQSWGGYLRHFCDPDGTILTLVQSNQT